MFGSLWAADVLDVFWDVLRIHLFCLECYESGSLVNHNTVQYVGCKDTSSNQSFGSDPLSKVQSGSRFRFRESQDLRTYVSF